MHRNNHLCLLGYISGALGNKIKFTLLICMDEMLLSIARIVLQEKNIWIDRGLDLRAPYFDMDNPKGLAQRVRAMLIAF